MAVNPFGTTFSYGKPTARELGGWSSFAHPRDPNASYFVKHSTPDKPASAPSATSTDTGGGTDLASLLGAYLTPQQMADLAIKTAHETLAPLVTQYHTEQTRALDQARQQQADILAASQAAANFVKPLGDVTANDYSNALTQLGTLAQGFSGQTAADATAEAQQAQQQFGEGRQALNLGGDLGNVLYGLGGAIPAQPLAAAGIAATSAARAFPEQLMGAGRQAGYSAIASGRQAAQAVGDKLNELLATQPQLVHQYLSDYQTQQDERTKAMIQLATSGKVFGDSKSGYTYWNPITQQMQPLTKGAALLPTTKIVSGPRGGITQVTFDPSTGQTTVTDLKTGEPVPARIVRNGDGSSVAIGYDKNGKPFSIRVTDPTPVKPVIRTTPDGGYKVFDGATGALLQSVPGTQTSKLQTVKAGDGTLYGVQPDGKGGFKLTNLGLPKGTAGVHLDTTASAAKGIEMGTDGFPILDAKRNTIPYPKKTVGGLTPTGTASLLKDWKSTIHDATNIVVPKYDSGGQLMTAGHAPDPYSQTLTTVLGLSPNLTKGQVRRATVLVDNAYRSVAKRLVAILHTGVKGNIDPLSQNMDEGLLPMNDPQLGPGQAYVYLIGQGYPPYLASEAVTNEYGISKAQLSNSLGQINIANERDQTVTSSTSPPSSGGGFFSGVSKLLPGGSQFWPGGDKFWPGGSVWWPGK